MKIIRRLIGLLVAAVILAGSSAANAQPRADDLFVSDIHFNPMAEPKLVDRLAAAPIADWDRIFDGDPQPLASYGADANAPLLRLAIAQMKLVNPNPPVIVISGDFLAHNYRDQWDAAASNYGDNAFHAFVDKTIAYMAAEFNAAFPHAQFVIALGNNDSPCGDYAPAPHSIFLAHFAQAWAPLVNRNGRAPAFLRDFAADGDYVAMLPNGTRAIVVNSNPWSPAAIRDCDRAGIARGETIAWYEHAVAASPRGAKTWVVEHIPPGMNGYGWLSTPPAPVPFFYATDILARFRAARAADGKPAGLILAGHLHNDGYRIVDGSPLLLVPSISPQHFNNPAFLVAHVDAAGALADYEAYNLNLPTATATTPFTREYGFDEAYGVSAFSADGLAQLQKSIHDDPKIRDAQAAHFVAGSRIGAISATNWHTYWCTNTALDLPAFRACLVSP
jgi:hypothetical protein